MTYACTLTVEFTFVPFFVNIIVLHNLSQMSVLISQIKMELMCQPEAQELYTKPSHYSLSNSLQSWAHGVPN